MLFGCFHAGRLSQTKGSVEPVHGTILEECLNPAFARYLVTEQTDLRHELEHCLRYYNKDRTHSSRWTRGRIPKADFGKARL